MRLFRIRRGHFRTWLYRDSTWLFLFSSMFVGFLIFILHGDDMDFVRNAREKDTENRLINKHEYSLLINEKQKCDSEILLLILVHSVAENHEMRQTIRETYGTVREYKGASVRTIFLLGTNTVHNKKASREKSSIQKESSIYHDIVMADFIDSYYNLTYKSVMGLYWVNKHCRKARYILKADDDVIVNVYKLVTFLLELDASSLNTQYFLYCNLWWKIRADRTGSKFSVSYAEYGYYFYPPYCDGPGYLYSNDVSESLYQASKYVPFYKFEDTFVGFCAKVAGITITANYFGYYLDTYIASHSLNYVPWDWVILKHIGRDSKHWYQLWNGFLSSSEQHSLIYYKHLKICFMAAFVSLTFTLLCLYKRFRVRLPRSIG